MTRLDLVLSEGTQLKGCTFKVYAALMEAFERSNNEAVELSFPELARRAGYSRASVAVAVNTLDELGLVLRFGARGGGTNRYQLSTTQSKNDPYPVQNRSQYPVQSVAATPPVSTAERRNPSFPQPLYKEVLSSLLSTDKNEQAKPERWKTEPDQPRQPEAKTFSVEVVEFAEACMEKKIIGVLRTQFGTLPHDLGIEPGIVAEFVARKWHEVWKRGRGKLHEYFTDKALYDFVRKDLAKAYGIELPTPVMPPRRPPTWEYSDRLQQRPYAAGEGRR